MKKLLLLSNSTNPGEEYLEWAKEYITDFLKDTSVKRILFIPYAGVTVNWDEYEAKVAAVFQELGYEIYSIHHFKDAEDAVLKAECIAIGGGNTFNLLYTLQLNDLMHIIHKRVAKGLPYIGWSAGSNVVCPSIKTTNDMPIAEPESFHSLDLIPFQINPHYLDANPAGHGGETRQQRIDEYLKVNQEIYVSGLREGTLLQVEGQKLLLKGRKQMRLFKYSTEPQEFNPGDDLDFLLESVV